MSSTRSHKARQLRSQLARHKADIATITGKIGALERDLKAKRTGQAKIEAQLEKLEAEAAVKVTDHAVIRYLERVQGLDVVAVRRQILHPAVIEAVSVLGGNGSYPHPDGYVLKMAGGVVVTVTNSGTPE